MPRVALVTDTTCNLPPDLVARYQVRVVPVYVIFGDRSYKDFVELPPETFYRRLAEYKQQTGKMPTTSQPTPEDFRQVYAELAQAGYEDIISIHVTAKSSGTCQSAQMAAGMIEGARVHVVDSGTTSMHMGFMLLEAAETLAQGGSVQEALAAVERVKAHSCLFFTVTEVEHLAASGRTEGAERVTQAAIQVKPIIGVIDGVPKAVATERTQKAALRRVLSLVQERMGQARPRRLAVVHGNIPDQAQAFARQAQEALGFDGEPYVVDFGPALAVHFGSGLLGVAAQWG